MLKAFIVCIKIPFIQIRWQGSVLKYIYNLLVLAMEATVY